MKKFEDKPKFSKSSDKVFSPDDIKYTGLVNAYEILKNASVINNQTITIAGLDLFGKKKTDKLIQKDAGYFATDISLANLYTPLQDKIAAQADLRFNGASGIDQGKAGDCWFEASLSALAATSRGQRLISSMITQEPNGTYRVIFPGEQAKPINVSLGNIFSINRVNTSLWANILESAVKKIAPNRFENGAFPTDGLSILTGDDVRSVYTDNIDSQSKLNHLRYKLQDLLNNQDPVVAAIDLDKQTQILHLFAVLNYNSTTDKITLRNPWGNNYSYGVRKFGEFEIPQAGQTLNGIDNLGNGIIKMPLTDFVKCFYILNYIPRNKTTFLNESKT